MSQFETQTSRRPRDAQLGERRRGVVEGAEPDRRHHRLDVTSRPSSRERIRAQRSRSSASDAASRPSWAARGSRPSRRGTRARASLGLLAERRGEVLPGRLELDQRAEGVEQHRSGRGASSREACQGQARGQLLGANGDWIPAAIDARGCVSRCALIVDRFVIGRAPRSPRGSAMSSLASRAAPQTRLRLIRRLVFVTIILIGVALALSQFTKLNRLATGLLASSAVLGLVLGLAARQLLANPSPASCSRSPSRSGSATRSRSATRPGRVDDITLAHTFIDTGDGRLMVVPNETVRHELVFNRSTGDRSAPATASVWVPPGRRPGACPRGARRARGLGGRGRRDRPRGRPHRASTARAARAAPA